MAEKIGVYFDAANIDAILDIEELSAKIAKTWGKLCPVIRTESILASKEGRAIIQADIDKFELDAVCICGATPRVDWEFYDFGKNILVDRVNLREQCVGTFPFKSVDAKVARFQINEIANDYINMGIIKLQKSNKPEPENLESFSRTILVLGGGWTGLSAALDAAKLGYEVILVEKQAKLGGAAGNMYKTIPLTYPFKIPHITGVENKIDDVLANELISVKLGSTVEKLAGAPGNYLATIKTGKEEKEIQVGAVVVATGWVRGDKKYLAPYGYGSLKNVMLSADFEIMAKGGKILRPSDGEPAKRVLFLLSLGEKLDDFAKAELAAKSEEVVKEENAVKNNFEKIDTLRHLTFASELSSMAALKQAGYVREFDKDAKAYIVYEHMMIPGTNELFYKEVQRDAGIMFTSGTIVSVTKATENTVLVKLKNTLLGEAIELEVDLVVVPTPVTPTTAQESTLKLCYRQGEAFPDLSLFSGFADTNYICFPYETRRTGIYAAGMVRQPMNLSMAEIDAAGAALKAIQSLESANRGVAVHPRSGDLSYPKFNMLRCTQCKRCTEECPFGALDEDEKGNPMPNPSRCRRCGTCMGACPERVISFDDYNVDQIGSMIKQINIPDDMAAYGPRILILACENDAYPALDMVSIQQKSWSQYVRIVPVRCLGSVNAIWIADAMAKGMDGCILMGCQYGEDYQCHFMKGSELCSKRMTNIGETLGKLGIETQRVQQTQVAIDEYNKIPDIIDDFVAMIMQLGPNPFKGY